MTKKFLRISATALGVSLLCLRLNIKLCLACTAQERSDYKSCLTSCAQSGSPGCIFGCDFYAFWEGCLFSDDVINHKNPFFEVTGDKINIKPQYLK